MRQIVPAGLIALLLVLPAQAGADFQQLYDEYLESGFVAGCLHGEDELRQALEEIPADIRAYDPGFADALDNALEQRAAGCDPNAVLDPVGSDESTAIAADGAPGPPDPRPPPRPAGEDPEEMPSVVIALLAALAALAAAAAIGALLSSLGLRLPRPRAPSPLRRLRAGLLYLADGLRDTFWLLRRRH